MKKLNLRDDQALIIQVIDEAGEEDIDALAESLFFERSKMLDALRALQHKGLVIVRRIGDGYYARLSAKGRKLTRQLWSAYGLSASR